MADAAMYKLLSKFIHLSLVLTMRHVEVTYRFDAVIEMVQG